jgi:hypothetical protein
MRAYLLALILGIMSLSGLALAPSYAEAHEWRSGGDAYGAHWRGGSHYGGWQGGYNGWRGGSHYYQPYYSGNQPSYGYPSYYNQEYYNDYYQGYNCFSPGYPSYRYYRPGVQFYLSGAVTAPRGDQDGERGFGPRSLFWCARTDRTGQE